MNKRTKLYVGIALTISAFTTLFTFIALCFKKKSALSALAAIAAAEGLIGLALIEDNKGSIRKKSAAEVDAEIFGADGIEFAEEASEELFEEYEVPKDEEACEEDFQ